MLPGLIVKLLKLASLDCAKSLPGIETSNMIIKHPMDDVILLNTFFW